MKKTHKHWMDNRTTKVKIHIIIAVNTESQKGELNGFDRVLVIGGQKQGVVHATNVLSRHVRAQDKDILVLVSDDFFAPKGWDRFLLDTFQKWDGAIMVADGYQRGGCVTIPIMTYKCLLRLNRFIYHPDYFWQFSDAELYHNLSDLKLLKNLRDTGPLFEHRHWANGKRQFDDSDRFGAQHGGKDWNTFRRRMTMSLKDRLK
jgi:hypothetical protein